MHSILIREVKGIKSHVLSTLAKKFKKKKNLKFHLELNFNNFQKQKDGKDYN